MRTPLTAFLLLAIGATSALAVNVRGRADISTATGSYPMNGAHVELCRPAPASCQRFTTGYDGMYYFTVDPGPYVVRINGVERKRVVVTTVPVFDIPGLKGNGP